MNMSGALEINSGKATGVQTKHNETLGKGTSSQFVVELSAKLLFTVILLHELDCKQSEI
jgi:hypothetical protein